MEIEIKATSVFEKNWEALNREDIRFIKNEGGSRSSKTYSICQCLILWALQNPQRVISIVRKTGPALSATVMRDFIEVLKDLHLWREKSWSKGTRTWTFDNGSIVEFFSVDSEQKLRGRKRDIAWVNEANELHYDDFQQLNLRTTEKIIVDYNPSEVDSYLYALPDEKTCSIHSTYLDNPFLSQAIIQEIEGYKKTDEDYYTIFGLGKRAYSRENVYIEWDNGPKPVGLDDWIYAIDYGYQHPTAMVKIWYNKEGRKAWIEELIYESYLTSNDIVEKIKALNVDKSKPIISETARPEIIADIKRAGYKIIEANKNVKDGINCVKTFEIGISPSSVNIRKENQNYRYKKHNGAVTEEIVKSWDDAMDAIRYGLMYVKKYLIRETSTTGQVHRFTF
jgi:phage terminase large subunit